ncbi:hypothetical protein KUTeg_015007 [Tegillarca granosa]|uniref:VWFD domain-containing protein n=1 Tax=Tegillarca granosa TaxID=220873 RepID=A0ABQ9ENV3_TEGGR|nr:hypothetical protein KUTeg_015007 [Tegillarca granosa]
MYDKITVLGLQINITLGIRMLTFSTTVPKDFEGQTVGLVGNFDGDDKNDFILPNGTILTENQTRTERQIFYNFGEHCKYNITQKPYTFTTNILNKIMFVPFCFHIKNKVPVIWGDRSVNATIGIPTKIEVHGRDDVIDNAGLVATPLDIKVTMCGYQCENDVNGCSGHPCSDGRNCTDLTPAEEANFGRSFNCSSCPKGYTENDKNKCSGKDQKVMIEKYARQETIKIKFYLMIKTFELYLNWNILKIENTVVKLFKKKKINQIKKNRIIEMLKNLRQIKI